MRHVPMIVPSGRLQSLCRVCHVSASCHINAIMPNRTADAPNRIRPYNAIFIDLPRNLHNTSVLGKIQLSKGNGYSFCQSDENRKLLAGGKLI